METSYLNWPFFDDSHRQLAEELKAWSDQHLAPLCADHEADPLSSAKKFVELFGKAGWLKNSVAGITGAKDRLDVRTLCLCREILAQYSGLAEFSFAMQGLGSGPISLLGSDHLKEKYLPKVTSGEFIAALAMSEAEAGSDVASISTTANLDGDEYVISGEKAWISNAGIADFYIVLARTGEAPGARGLSTFVVDTQTIGFSVTEQVDVIAPHPLGNIKFDNCRIPKENLIGNSGEGFKVVMSTLDVFRSTVGAAALGFARRALSEAVIRANSRKLFGKSLAEQQITQDRIADMATEVDASALLVYRAAWQKDNGAPRVTREASMAKLYSTEAAQRIIDKAVQLFGGVGVTSGSIVEQLYRDIRPLRIYEGASEIQKIVIAREVLKQ